MIIGVGTDIVDIKRIHKACEKQHFMERCFTADEMKIISRRKDSAATNFAGKEAVAKMLQTGFGPFGLTDIEILRDEKGKPYVNLYNNAKAIAEELEINSIHISLSDTSEVATAFVVGEKV